jgi:gamma-glutamyl-gamma-aminobutyrate hydrolase PuuD
MIQGTNINIKRDLEEIRLIKRLPSELPKIGICRGGQLLNVMAGGSMFQDVSGHAIRGLHDMQNVADGHILMVTSTHHQMMIPSDKAFIIGLAKEAYKKEGEKQSITYRNPHRQETWDDTEVVYYEHCNSFCFQPHPEYVKPDHDCQEYFFHQIEAYCF